MIVFDTDVVSYVMRPRPPAGLLRRIAMVPAAEQATTAISVGELVYGARRSTRPEHYLDALRRLLLPNVAVLPFDRAAAEVYGELRAALERRGSPLPEPDLRIGAICIRNGASLATGNVRHYRRIPGLEVEDWLAGHRER
jgi:tRNA(fMet)-specific endonuclease VapC